MDIVLGLKWIRKNILGFGGDPSNIVLLGHGSEAALVDILTLTPITNDLIHKAVILSGSALAPWAVSYKSKDNANAVGKTLGISNASSPLLATSLKTVSLENLSIAINDINRDKMAPLFAPCIGTSSDVLSDEPINLLKANNFKRIPYLTGYVKNEGTIKAGEIINGSWTEEMRRNIVEYLPPDIKIESNETDISNEIRHLYFTYYFNDPKEKEIKEVLNYVGDVLEIMPILRSVQERVRKANFSGPKDYLFEFQYQGTNYSTWGYPEFIANGPNHGDLINFILDFGLIHTNNTDMSGHAVTSMKKRLITFAHTCVPEEEENQHFVSWSPVSHIDIFQYFLIRGSYNTVHGQSQETHPYKEKFDIWDKIYSKYYRPHVDKPKGESPHSSASALKYGVLLLISYIICLL